MITGIQYGGQCTVTASYHYKNEIDKDILGGSLSLCLNAVVISIEGKVSMSSDTTETFESTQFQCSWTADAMTTEPNPADIADAIAQAKRFPELLEEVNDGKGVPLILHLSPIETICSMFSKELKQTVLLNSIAESVVIDVTDVSKKYFGIVCYISSMFLRYQVMTGLIVIF